MNSIGTQHAAIPLQGIKVSPIDEALSAVHAHIQTLETEFESFCKDLQPIVLEIPRGESKAESMPPKPSVSSVEAAIINASDRLMALGQRMNYIHSCLRV